MRHLAPYRAETLVWSLPNPLLLCKLSHLETLYLAYPDIPHAREKAI